MRRVLFFALLCLLVGLPRLARAGGAESISSSLPGPQRFLFQNGKYVDVTSSPRPQNLNPLGVSFTDCEQDLRLDFALLVSGFDPADAAHIEAWAGGSGCGGSPGGACWQVASPTAPVNAPSTQMLTLSVFARDLLRYEQPPTAGGSEPYQAGFHDGPDGESACHMQTSDPPVQLSVFLLAVTSNESPIGSVYQWTAMTDLVAPAPPSQVSASPGSNLLDVSWTPPQHDADRIGFALWTAPSQSGSCASPALQDREWALPSGQGVSAIPSQNLAVVIDDPTATTLTQTQVPGGTRFAAVVTSVDGSGNYGPPSPAACAEPTGPSSPPPMDASSDANATPTTVKAGCGCAAAGRRGPGWTSLLAALALVGTLAHRRASRGCSIDSCADGSAS